MKQELKVINSFSDKYKYLSNFYPAMVKSEGITFPTVEHAYQASKSNDPADWLRISRVKATDAGYIKRYGRKIKLRKDWNMIKLSIMRRFLKQKFENYDNLKNQLLSTGDAILVEGNYWHDNYWGDCRCEKCSEIKGQNQLGKMLMKIRGDLSAKSYHYR